MVRGGKNFSEQVVENIRVPIFIGNEYFFSTSNNLILKHEQVVGSCENPSVENSGPDGWLMW